MRIGIACFANPGGSGTVASELARDLARRGHAVHVFASSLPLRLDPPPAGVRFHDVAPCAHPALPAPDGTLALAGRIAEVAEAERLDVVHAHYAVPHAVAAHLAREILRDRRPLPIVATVHGTDVTSVGVDPSYRAATRFALERSDAVTAVSRALGDAVTRAFGVRDVRTIPNFVDAAAFSRREPPPKLVARVRPRGERVLVHVSSFRPVKRATDCVRILARVACEVPCRLLLVGDGPDVRATAALARELGVSDDVLLVGPQSRVVDHLAVADVLLLPSATESFGLAALEAMSCGLPVVASRVGGLPEVVEDGVSGRLLPSGDVDAMAAAVLELLRDRALAAAMGAAGRRIAVERFAAQLVVPTYLELYRAVVARRARACTAA